MRRLATGGMMVAAAVLGACGGPPDETRPAMPAAAARSEEAPPVFRVRFETSKGPFVVEARRAWAPLGVDRFYQLARSGFFDNVRFFRAVSGFMVQFGVHGDPKVNKAWDALAIADDTVAQSNRRGMLTFAMGGPNTRTSQMFINLVDNTQLDGQGFAPVGQVVEGMAVIDSLYMGYGDGPPGGFGPDQGMIMQEGNAYLERQFPKLDFIRTARLLIDSAITTAPAASATRDSTR